MHIFEQKNLLKKTGCHQILSGGLFRTLFLTATDCADIDWCASSDNLIALHLTKAQQKDQHGFSCAKKTVAIDKKRKTSIFIPDFQI